MRQQNKSFIVEVKPSRKRKPTRQPASIWGDVNLSIIPDLQLEDGMPMIASTQEALECGTPDQTA